MILHTPAHQEMSAFNSSILADEGSTFSASFYSISTLSDLAKLATSAFLYIVVPGPILYHAKLRWQSKYG